MPGHCWDARSSVSGWIGLVFAFSRGSLEYARSAADWARVTGWLKVGDGDGGSGGGSGKSLLYTGKIAAVLREDEEGWLHCPQVM